MIKFIFVFSFFLNLSIYSQTINLTNGEWPPYFSQNMKNYGIASNIITKAFENENIKVNYGFFPWKRSIELAKSTKWNGTVGWTKTLGREDDFYYSEEPIFKGKLVFFSLKSESFNWNSFDDLKKFNIGLTNGYSYGNIFDFYLDNKTLNIEIANEDILNFKKLFSKRIDIFPIDLEVGMYILNNYFTQTERNLLTYHSKSIDERSYYLLLSKNPQNKIFMNKFNQGYKTLKENKKFNVLTDNYKSYLFIRNSSLIKDLTFR